MTTAAVVHALAGRGVRLTVEGANLRAFGPLTDADRELIREHKPALVALLAGAEPGPTAPPVDNPGPVDNPTAHCDRCGSPSWWRSPSSPTWRCAWCAPRPRGSAEAVESLTLDAGRWRAGTHPPVPEPTTRADLLALHGETVAGCRLADVLEQADDDDLPELRDRLLLEAFAVALLADRRLRPLPPRALDPAAPREPLRPEDGRVQDAFGAWRTPAEHAAVAALDAHHWRCAVCIRAGRGYGERCPEGAALHAVCRAAVREEPAP